MSRFVYKRSPKVISLQEKEEITIQKPPVEPVKPTLNIISIIVPIMTTVVGSSAMIMFSKSMGRGNYYIIQLIAMITMVVSYLVPIVLHIQQKKQFSDQVKKRKKLYANYLDENREKLQSMKNELILNLHTNHPEPDFALQWAKERNSAIWSRIPSDPDFMKIRLGLGTIPSEFPVTVPQQDSIEKEPLIENAHEMVEKFVNISNVPVLLNFRKYRVVGIVGTADRTKSLTRAIIKHLALHHSPDELKLATFYSRHEAEEWQWLRWLPHIWDDQRKFRFMFEEFRYNYQILENLVSYLQRRRWIGQTANNRMSFPSYMFIVPEMHLVEQDPIWPMLLNESDKINTSCIVLAENREDLPKECQLVIECHDEQATMRSTTVATSDNPEKEQVVQLTISPDYVTIERARLFARAMAPYQLKKATADEIPGILTLFQLFEIEQIEKLKVVEHWNAQRFPNTLPASIGVKGGGKKVALNIHDKIEKKGHGPHGLMAGTTGSGKSEVIQTLIASLAVNYHPHDLAFMLIDYKGGGMSNTFANLPHVIATITNLEEEGLIERSKVSLKAELERRQKLFVQAGNVQHIDEYYKSSLKLSHPLPHLVIVIDEFAQLKKDQPEFMSELVSIAAIGRTLGVHLLLATQKPSGVVDDKIWSNSRYKICLRVQDEADSREMIKIPDASYITIPGRGYLQVGTNEVFESVQYAWSGAPYNPDAAMQAADENLYSISIDGSRKKLEHHNQLFFASQNEDKKELKSKQLDILIQWIANKAEEAGVHRLPGPWLPPLPNYLTLEQVLDGHYAKESLLKPVIGLIDDVSKQSQIPLIIDIESGNWLVFGMPGTGKTTLLQTMLYSLSENSSPEEVHVYIIDFSRMFKDYILLPQVADVLQEEDFEKFTRLFSYLDSVITQRKQLFSDTGVKSRKAYCEDTGQSMPAIVLAIDGYINLKAISETVHERFENLIRIGASLGIYVVMTANRPSEILEKIKSNFPNTLSLELADSSDYHYVVGRMPSSPGRLPEGRGFVKGQIPPLQFQTALSIDARNDAERSKQLRERFTHMDQLWVGDKPSPIATLPEIITFDMLSDRREQHVKTTLMIGLQVADLKPFLFKLDDGPYFIVSGRMESGKTALLTSIAMEMTKVMPPSRLKLFLSDFRRNEEGLVSINQLDQVEGYVTEERSLEQMITTMRNEVERRVHEGYQPNEDPELVFIMDDADITAKRISSMSTITQALDYIVQNGRDNGFKLFISGAASDLQQIYDGWMKSVKAAQTGFLLGTTEMSDLQFFGIKLPYELSGKQLPAGEGFYIRRKYQNIKSVYPFDEKIAAGSLL